MLQQTQVAVVLPYFERWMKRFPQIQDLARAPLDDVIKLWEGLGYYSRARNLHAGARQLVAEHAGELPSDRKQLLRIKGIGRYTANAILSFAFHQDAVPVDGNVLRVGCRYFGLEDDIAKPKTRDHVENRFREWIPEQRPWELTEALIELGARECGRIARCEGCPLRGSCRAYALGLQDTLPINSRKTQVEELERAVAVVICDRHLLLRCGAPGRVMADLYEFPYFASEGSWTAQQMIDQLAKLGLETSPVMAVDPVRHTFTRYRVRLHPWIVKAQKRSAIEGALWISFDRVKDLPFSSGHRRLLAQIDLS